MIFDEMEQWDPVAPTPRVLTETQKRNQDVADRINREALANPQSPYARKYVGVANGEVVVVADTLSGALGKLRDIEPDQTRTCCVEASRDYSVVEEIWETA